MLWTCRLVHRIHSARANAANHKMSSDHHGFLHCNWANGFVAVYSIACVCEHTVFGCIMKNNTVLIKELLCGDFLGLDSVRWVRKSASEVSLSPRVFTSGLFLLINSPNKIRLIRVPESRLVHTDVVLFWIRLAAMGEWSMCILLFTDTFFLCTNLTCCSC